MSERKKIFSVEIAGDTSEVAIVLNFMAGFISDNGNDLKALEAFKVEMFTERDEC